MKKLLIFFLFAVMIHEVRAVVPAIAVNNMREQQEILDKKKNAIYNNGFILLNKENKIEEILENKKIPKFYLDELNSYNTIDTTIKYLRKKFKKKDVEILYIEVIPFYDRIKTFIIFDIKDKKETKIEEKKWYE